MFLSFCLYSPHDMQANIMRYVDDQVYIYIFVSDVSCYYHQSLHTRL